MPINNYLITGINPANLEKQVLVDKTIRIQFAKHMKKASVENHSNIFLQKVNNEKVPVELVYNSEQMFVDVNPISALEDETQYEVHVVGDTEGVVSILDEYMQFSRTYEFTTGSSKSITEPLNLMTNIDADSVILSWDPPAQYDNTLPFAYQILISTSNVAPATPESYVWPDSPEHYETTFRNKEIRKSELTGEGPYYVYVRAVNGKVENEWVEGPWEVHQFSLEAPIVTPAPSPTTPLPGFGSFDVTETYPRANSANLTPENIVIMFSDALDIETVKAESVYVIKQDTPPGRTLSSIDFVTGYRPEKAIPATLPEALTLGTNMLVIEAELERDATYTVIVRETVANASGDTLGIAHHFSFVTEYSTLYGDAELVRSDMGSFSDNLDDKTLYRYLNDTSIYAYELVSRMGSFNLLDYEEGRAPYYVHQYVRLKTLHDLLLHTQLHKDGGGAVKNISLGDLTVAKETDAGGTSLSSLLSQVRLRLKPFMDMMQGHNNRGYAKPLMVVRGESGQAEPEFLTRSEYRELGQ